MRETDHIHLLKLSVGTESVDGLEAWIDQYGRRRKDRERHVHVTRMWPRQEAKVLAGGSMYWVIRGQIQCRQKIIGLEEATSADGIRRCAIVMEPALIRTTTAPRRPFQGWRYLDPADAPPDLPSARSAESALPPRLEQALSDIGLR